MRLRNDTAHRKTTRRRSCRWLILAPASAAVRAAACAATPIVASTENAAVQSPLFQRMLMLLHCPFPVERNLPRRWSWSLRLLCSWPRSRRRVSVFAGHMLRALEQGRRRRGQWHGTKPSAWLISSRHPSCTLPRGHGLPHHMPVALSSRFDLTSRGALEQERPGEDSHRRTSLDQRSIARIT